MILHLINEGEAELSHYKIENPRLNSELLLSKILKTDRTLLYFDFDREITKDAIADFKKLIQLRCQHTPIQHLTGTQAFRNLELFVGPGVFIPRPETEQLVSIALDVIPSAIPAVTPAVIPAKAGIHCLDIGTGTGAIPLAITSETSDTYFDAVELSPDAFIFAERNLKTYLQLRERINLILADIFTFTPTSRYDLIISNPPYIPTDEIRNLPPEVSNGDPFVALDGGGSGVEFLFNLADLITDWLAPNGWFISEIGEDQGDRIIKHFKEKKFKNVSIKQDFNKRDRFLIASGV